MLIAWCHPVPLSPGERCECFLQQSKLNTSDLFKFWACEKWPSGNSLRNLPSAWIYVQWTHTHSCRQMTWEGEKQNQDLCFGKQEVQESECQNQIIRSAVVMQALVKQPGREKPRQNDGVTITGVASPKFSSASSGKLESNVPKQQIHFSTYPSLFQMLHCM